MDSVKGLLVGPDFLSAPLLTAPPSVENEVTETSQDITFIAINEIYFW